MYMHSSGNVRSGGRYVFMVVLEVGENILVYKQTCIEMYPNPIHLFAFSHSPSLPGAFVYSGRRKNAFIRGKIIFSEAMKVQK